MSEGWEQVYLSRHQATSGYRSGEYELYAPTSREGGLPRYGVYGFRNYVGDVWHLGALKEGMAARQTLHGACVKTGSWFTSSHDSIAGGTAARSNEPGASLEGTVFGHTIVLRTVRTTNGGMALISIDGDGHVANRLPVVEESDLLAITGIVANGGGEARVTCPGHGLATGAVIEIENAAGTTGVDGRREVSVVDDDTFNCVGTTLGGVYSGGGTCGYFRAADLGKRYCDFFGTGAVFWDEQAPLAEGLPLAEHVVRIEPLGTGRGGIASGARTYVTALLACGEARLGEADAVMAYVDEMFQERTGTAFLSFGSVVEFEPEGGSAQFLGENHGFETLLDQAWWVDGKRASLAPGEVLAGDEVRLERSLTIAHPEGSGATAEVRTTFEATAGGLSGLRRSQRWAWKEPGLVSRAYHGMAPVGVRPPGSSAYEQALFESAKIGAQEFGLTPHEVRNLGEIPADRMRFCDARRGAQCEVLLHDVAETMDHWQRSEGAYAFVWQRDDGVDKAYFTRVASGNEETIVGGERERHDMGWHAWRRASPTPELKVGWSVAMRGCGETAACGERMEIAAGEGATVLARIEDASRADRPVDPLHVARVELRLIRWDAARRERGSTAAERRFSAREAMSPRLQRSAVGRWKDAAFNLRATAPGEWTKDLAPGDYLLEATAAPWDGTAAKVDFLLRVIR